MDFIYKLPSELIIKIFEYTQEHSEQMRPVFEEIRNMQYCDFCKKVIIKKIYSMRRSDIICCSMECVDSVYYAMY